MHPPRPLTLIEALHVTERQAHRLLAQLHVDRLPVPIEIFDQLAGIAIHRFASAPVAGASYWNGVEWIIVIDDRLADADQRLALAHEIKHVIDAPHPNPYTDDDWAESIADYFARCLLAPRPWVKAEIGRGQSDIDELRRRAEMTCRQMCERLAELGLADQIRRSRWTGRSRCCCSRVRWR